MRRCQPSGEATIQVEKLQAAAAREVPRRLAGGEGRRAVFGLREDQSALDLAGAAHAELHLRTLSADPQRDRDRLAAARLQHHVLALGGKRDLAVLLELEGALAEAA